MPSLTGAQRNLSPPPSAKRSAWYCPQGCKPRNIPMGYAPSADEACTAGIRHFLLMHDTNQSEAR